MNRFGRIIVGVVAWSIMWPIGLGAFLGSGNLNRLEAAAAWPQDERLGLKSIPAAEWVAVDGTAISLKKEGGANWTVVCFVGNDCPLVRLYAIRLNALQAEFAPQGVRFVAVNSNRQDTVEQIAAFARDQSLGFPVVSDPFHRVADLFGATRTPEIFVLDGELNVRYQGRIDDQYLPGVSRQEPKRRDLALALEQLVAGGPVAVPQTQALGCLIGRVIDVASAEETSSPGRGEPDGTPTFAQHVAPVVYRHCGECHRPNDIGPFSLIDYEDVRGWGAMMVEVIDQGLMPPWHANPEYGKFSNHREMPESDKQLIRDWVAAGAPLGDPGQLPAGPEPAAEWLLPKAPDLVVPMGSVPFEVPAEGTVDYRHFLVDPELKEDVWVKAAQIVPGNRRVVHHSIVFIKPPDGSEAAGQGWLAAYVPGQRPLPYPPGYARRIPAGSKFVFQQHYTPNGVPQSDITSLGLVFVDPAEVTHQVDTLVALNQDFTIPPHAADFRVSDGLKSVPQQAAVLGMSPHMHYRGKSFRVTAVRGEVADNGEPQREIILDVPRYDFNWQHVYAFQQPWELRGISHVEFEASFDNSPQNPANPDPSKAVTWGDQSWEEMAIIYFDVAWRIRSDDGQAAAVDSEDVGAEAGSALDRGTPPSASPQVSVRTTATGVKAVADDGLTQDERDEVERQVTSFFNEFGQPGQATIPKSQLPEAIRRFAGLDRDGDDRISRQEVWDAFRDRELKRRR